MRQFDYSKLKAIEAGIFTPTTKERMEELEQQKEELNISLIRAQMAQPVFTKEEIVKWISRFKYGNINDKAYQREMIDTFLNSVYVYDDKIVFTYNFRDHAETVTLDEIEYVFCSDVNDCPPPTKKTSPLAMSFFVGERRRWIRTQLNPTGQWPVGKTSSQTGFLLIALLRKASHRIHLPPFRILPAYRKS